MLSYILRHDPTGYTMDKNGWIPVSEILSKLDITSSDLETIVAENDKKRFVLSEDKTKIKAAQGHTLKVDVELKKAIPPVVLYHGTAEQNIASILKSGLDKRKRLHVHLSEKPETAIQVGSRWGKPVLLKIDTRQMVKDGIPFYLSENGVWLTDRVDSKYISV